MLVLVLVLSLHHRPEKPTRESRRWAKSNPRSPCLCSSRPHPRRPSEEAQPGSGQVQESQLVGGNGTCEGRQASAVEDVCLTLGLSGGWLMLP